MDLRTELAWNLTADELARTIAHATELADALVELRPDKELVPDRYEITYPKNSKTPNRWVDYNRVTYDPAEFKSLRGRLRAMGPELRRLRAKLEE